MSGTIPIKYLRSVTFMKLALAFCAISLVGFVGFVLWFCAYMKNEPSMAELQSNLLFIQQQRVRPGHFGVVIIKGRHVYVTHAADGSLTALWPYNLAHDDNYFEGYLFSDHVLTPGKTTAFAPDRTAYTAAPKYKVTHLTVDRNIRRHWYHVQGEMNK